jgi:DNA-binding CsgD family transcriptional regulator
MAAMERTRLAESLTPRQREVLRLVVRGHTNGEIAERLGISLQGAKWHVRELTTKFGVESREELIDAWAAERSVGARLRGIAGLFAGLGLPKAGVAAGLSALTLAAAGAAVVVSGAVTQGQDAGPAPTPTPSAEERRAYFVAANARLGPDSRAASQPVGPEVVVAWLNGVAGAEHISAYPTASGLWCKAYPNGSEGCFFAPEYPDEPIQYGREESYYPATGTRTSRIHIESSEEVVLAVLYTYDGRRIETVMHDAPPGIPRGTRYAYLDIGLLDGDPPLIIGYDEHGREVGRRTGPGGEPPPGANGPPPTAGGSGQP